MIERWISSPLSSMFCIPIGWVGKVMIDHVGCPRKEDLLKSNPLQGYSF